jgi:hypothetical protein
VIHFRHCRARPGNLDPLEKDARVKPAHDDIPYFVTLGL